jgi:hypothetical protein
MKPAVTPPILLSASLPPERITRCIYLARGERVMLDRDLAVLYGVETRVLNQAVRRNRERFPEDFLFELSRDEIRALANLCENDMFRHSKAAFAFTEQGVAMLSSVLRSDRAAHVNVAIMRTFVQLRRMLASHADLAGKLEALEKKYDAKFRVVFDAIRELMEEKRKPRREIGFHTHMPGHEPNSRGKSRTRIST